MKTLTNLLQWASCNGHTEIVRLLLEDGRADPTADNNYAIRWASIFEQTEVVRLLKEYTRRSH